MLASTRRNKRYHPHRRREIRMSCLQRRGDRMLRKAAPLARQGHEDPQRPAMRCAGRSLGPSQF